MSVYNLVVRTSDVAACIGKNQWKPQTEVLDYYIARYQGTEKDYKVKNYASNIHEAEKLKNEFNNVNYQKDENTVKYINDRFENISKIEDNNEQNREIKKYNKFILDNASKSAINSENPEECQVKKRKIVEKVSNIIDNSNDISNEICSNINKQVGCKKETENINTYEQKVNKKVESRNSKLHYLTVDELGPCKVTLVGKIDGKTSDNILIESKNRQNRLFNHIPVYEKIQMEIYMRMIDVTKGQLVENYKNQQLIHDYERDDELWNTIKLGLIEFRD